MYTRKFTSALFLFISLTAVVSKSSGSELNDPEQSEAKMIQQGQVDHDQIARFASSIFLELVAFRRDMYAHPELAGKEKRAAAKVAAYLNKLGLAVKTDVGGHGVVATLQGATPGRHIAWRADLDAAVDHYGHMASSGKGEPPVKHVCGHDINTTIALGIAKTLAQHQEQLTGTVSFIFQPAEETQEGAIAMLKGGLFDMIQPDEIYASHIGPMQVGTVATRAGNSFTHARTISMEFETDKDTDGLIETLNGLINDLTRKPTDKRFDDLSHLIDPVIGLAVADTIYKDFVIFEPRPQIKQFEGGMTFQTQLYTTEKNELDHVFEQLKKEVSQTQYSNQLSSLTYEDHREGVDNDPELVDAALKALGQLFGHSSAQRSYGQIPYSSEDFGHFQKTVPGVYFFLGAANQQLGHNAYPHMPGFTPDETSIQFGVSYFSSLIIARLDAQDISVE